MRKNTIDPDDLKVILREVAKMLNTVAPKSPTKGDIALAILQVVGFSIALVMLLLAVLSFLRP